MSEKVCPYCKGKRFLGTGYKEVIQGGHRTLYPYTEPCYCTINKNIDSKFGLLSGVGDAHPRDIKKVRMVVKKYGNNIWFEGRESVFLYFAKCYFMSIFNSKKVMILEGGTIVIKYNTVQPDGDWLSTEYLNQYDLLVILFTTSAKYPSLKDSVLDVVKNRSRLKVSTWIYTPISANVSDCHEHSPEMQNYLEEYRLVKIGDGSTFEGYNRANSSSAKNQNVIRTNEIAGGAE